MDGFRALCMWRLGSGLDVLRIHPRRLTACPGVVQARRDAGLLQRIGVADAPALRTRAARWQDFPATSPDAARARANPRSLAGTWRGIRECGERNALSWMRAESGAWASGTRRDGAVRALAWGPTTFPADARAPVPDISFPDVFLRQPVKECGDGRGPIGRLGQDSDHP